MMHGQTQIKLTNHSESQSFQFSVKNFLWPVICWCARKKLLSPGPEPVFGSILLEEQAILLQDYWLPPNTCAMNATSVFRRAVSKLRAQTGAVRLRSNSRLAYFA
jgi:hypothetical protein